MASEGTGPLTTVTPAIAGLVRGSWSADGHDIVYSDHGVVVVSADGKQQFRLTSSDDDVGDAGYLASGVPAAEDTGSRTDDVSGGVSTPRPPGYRMVAPDGGVFDFGGAAFLGSMGGTHSTGRSWAWRRRRQALAIGWPGPTAVSSASATRRLPDRWATTP